jgi:hypothetical protein
VHVTAVMVKLLAGNVPAVIQPHQAAWPQIKTVQRELPPLFVWACIRRKDTDDRLLNSSSTDFAPTQ